MESRGAEYPIIIIGMHRSGTSMLCNMLGELGIFFGRDQTQVNYESSFFLEINRWLFEQCGATWDRPAAVKELFAHDQLCAVLREYMVKVLRSRYSVNFLGTREKDGVFALSGPWGWKDPRNTYTLPLWLDIFPQARVLNVVRNGIDVAQSLKVREERYQSRKRPAIEEGKILNRENPFSSRFSYRKIPRLMMSLRSLSLEGGFSLWEEYMQEAAGHVARLGERAQDVCYERLLQHPGEMLTEICRFCGVEPHAEQLAATVKGVRSERANAYAADPVLSTFATANQHRLASFGY